MGSASLKVTGGKLVNARVNIIDGSITSIRITGDFFLHPEEAIFEIESSLMNRKPDEDNISIIIEKVLFSCNAHLIGASPRDLAKVVVEASR